MKSADSHDSYQAAWQECILNDRPIDWKFWVQKMPVLSALQASALMNGLDPGIHRDVNNTDAEVKKAMTDSERLVSLALAFGVDQLSPTKWLDWAESQKIVVHALYRIEVLKLKDTLNGINATKSESRMPRKEKSEPDWISKARVLAMSYREKLLDKDLHPSVTNIADWVAEELRSKGIYGAQGTPLSGATIKRHALAGMSTQQEKLKAIPKQWGKRGKK